MNIKLSKKHKSPHCSLWGYSREHHTILLYDQSVIVSFQLDYLREYFPPTFRPEWVKLRIRRLLIYKRHINKQIQLLHSEERRGAA